MNFEATPESILALVSGVGGANYAAAEFFNWDLMTEVLSSSPELGAAVFGAAGVVMVTERLEVTELFD